MPDLNKSQPTELDSPGNESHFLGTKDLLRLSFRVFRTKPLRTFLTIMGMSLGVGVVLALTSLGYGLQYLLIGKLITTEDSLLTLDAYYAPEGDIKILHSKIEEIGKFEGVKEISHLAEFPAEVSLLGQDEDASSFILGRVVDSSYERLSGTIPSIRTKISLTDDHSALVSLNALKSLSLPTGEESLDKKIDVKVFYPSVESAQDGEVTEVKVSVLRMPLTIRGILTDESLPPFVLVPEDSLVSEPPYYERIYVRADKEENIEGVRQKLIDSGFLVSSKIDLVKQIKKITSVVTIILGVFGITALAVSAIGMFNTMVISFMEKIYEVGIMKAIGATDRDIRNLFLMESFIVGIMGGLGGIFIGVTIGEVVNLALNLLAKNFGGKPVDLFVRPWWFMIAIVVLSGIIGLLSGYWPARRATNVSPKEAFMRK